MENTSYALHIAIGVLIGIAILSLIVFYWRKFGVFEKAKDESIEVKNRADFNAEYLAYDKNLMYGSDILSCLNKAQNNNQKYVYNNYYGQETETMGKEAREEYLIDVQVTINSALCETIKAYWKDSSGKYQRVVGGLTGVANASSNYGYNVFSPSSTMHFDIPTVYYYYFKKGKLYQEKSTYTSIMGITPGSLSLYKILSPDSATEKAGEVETSFAAGEYHLLQSEDVTDSTYSSSLAGKKESAYLSALITTVSLKEQTLLNKDQPTSFNKSDWWYCTWSTAASDFKSRKFKCTGVKYDKNTGYINKIIFEEI